MARSSEYQTVNTFSRSPSPAQICSYVIIVLESCIFYIMIRPKIVGEVASYVFTILFSISLVVLIISTFICSYIDPSDSVMIKCKTGRRSEIETRPQELLYCEYCCSSVTTNAKHCRQCDRCVQEFDHHCMWINNCVGSKNYSQFIVMITSTCVNLAVYLASVAYLSAQKHWSQFMGFIITCWVVMVVVFVLWFLLLNLNLLHFYLMCKGYTTYQFIVARKEEERLKQFEQSQKLKRQKEKKLKTMIQNSKKKVFELESIDINRNEVSGPSNNKETPLKSKNRLRSQQSQKMAQSHENTNSKINLDTKIKSSGSKQAVNLQTTEAKVRHSIPINTESNIQNVFGSDDNKNSDAQSIQLDPNQVKDDRLFKQVDIRPVNQRIETQSENESIRISQFFIRNKSFNFILNNDVAEKPHKILNNLSLDAEPRMREKDRSLKERNKSKSSSEQMLRGDPKKQVKRSSKLKYQKE